MQKKQKENVETLNEFIMTYDFLHFPIQSLLGCIYFRNRRTNCKTQCSKSIIMKTYSMITKKLIEL